MEKLKGRRASCLRSHSKKMSAGLNVDTSPSITGYSLSEARRLAERISENLPSSESETSLSEMSENSASSKLTPEQKELLEPEDEFEEDELEEGEIRQEEPAQREEIIPCLKANSSRSLSVTNQDNTTLHLSVYTENDERKIYIYADAEFNLPVAAFREYMNELLEDDILALERQRHDELEKIVKASLALGAFVAGGLILWLYYLIASLSRLR